jgi:hypothetical protein
MSGNSMSRERGQSFQFQPGAFPAPLQAVAPGGDYSRERIGSMMFSGGVIHVFQAVFCLVSFTPPPPPPLVIEELSSQLAEFAFYEDADGGDDTPHTRTRSVSERSDRDVCLPCLILSYAAFSYSVSEFPVVL